MRAEQLTTHIMDTVKVIADIEDEELDKEDLMDIWYFIDAVDSLDQPHRNVITKE